MILYMFDWLLVWIENKRYDIPYMFHRHNDYILPGLYILLLLLISILEFSSKFRIHRKFKSFFSVYTVYDCIITAFKELISNQI